jgi:hypothetical protein
MSQKYPLSDVSKLLLINYLYGFLSGVFNYFSANDLSGLKRGRSNKIIINKDFKVLKALPTFIRAKN